MNDGWKVERRYSRYTSREVFVSPEGIAHERCKPEVATVTLQTKTRGLPPLYLRPVTWRVDNLKGKKS